MDNQIALEYNLSSTKMIKTCKDSGRELAIISLDNIAIAEAMIRSDSNYFRSFDINAKPINKNKKYRYGGSSAFWMTQLKDFLINGVNENYSYEKIIAGAVESVDRENSTHINADRCGRREIIDRICQIGAKELKDCLRNLDQGDAKLIKLISEKTSAKQRARTNLSFASKFCHYACFYVFEGTEYQDNYPIYDSVLKTVIPWYLDFFKINKEYNLNCYTQYRNAVDSIISKANERISRNGLDQLLWYYHKGRV